MTDQDLNAFKREDLNALAKEAGVSDPESLDNKDAVIEAIELAKANPSAAAPTPQNDAEAAASATAGAPPEEVADGEGPEAAVTSALAGATAGKDEQEPVARLIEQSYDFFGHEPHVAAGAFHHLPSDTTTLTRKQGAAVIEAWLESTPVTG